MKNSIIIISGSFVTNLGNSMYLVSLLIFAVDYFNDPVVVGLIQTSAYLPVVLFSLEGGKLADRINRPFLIAGTDLIRSLLLILAALFIPLLSGINKLAVILVLVLSGSVLQAFFSPAVVSFILEIKAGKKDLLSLRTGIAHFASLAGQITGGLLYSLKGIVFMLTINSVCFFISGLSELFLKETPERVKRSISKEGKITLKEVAEEFLTFERKGEPVLLYFGLQAVNSMVIVNLPFFITERLGYDSYYIGFALAALLGGSIVSGIFLGITGFAYKIRIDKIYLTALLSSCIYFTASLLDSSFISLYLLIFLLISAGGSLGFLHLITVHRIFLKGSRKTAAARQGFLQASSAAVLPLSYMASSFFISKLPLDTPAVLRSASVLSFLLVIYGYYRNKK